MVKFVTALAAVARHIPQWPRVVRAAPQVIGALRYAEVLVELRHPDADRALAEADVLMLTPVSELLDRYAPVVLDVEAVARDVARGAATEAVHEALAELPQRAHGQLREPGSSEIVDMKQACSIAGRKAPTLRRWIRTGRLRPTQTPPFTSCTRYTFRREEVERARDRSASEANVVAIASLDARVDAMLERRRQR